MPRSRAFAQVDVFSSEPYLGNPVAVVLDAEGLDTDAMHRLARWTNLSETTFVLPPSTPEADYRLRIFTPGGELPFAGHPTLGSAHAWLEAGGVPKKDRILQECGAGLVELRRTNGVLAFAAPPTLRSGALDDEYLQRIASAFGIARDRIVDHEWVDNGPGWAVVQLATADEVLALEPDLAQIPDTKIGAVGAYPKGGLYAFEIRAFAPGVGVPEDPVTGSLNASVAQWLTGTGRAQAPYRVSQGARLGRTGDIRIDRDPDGTVWVGGVTTTCFSGAAVL